MHGCSSFLVEYDRSENYAYTVDKASRDKSNIYTQQERFERPEKKNDSEECWVQLRCP